MKQDDAKDFFISYTHTDRAWAEWIAWQLEAEGYTTSLQAWDFRPGSNFVLQMQEIAAKAKRTIAVLSPDYLQAQYPQPEWAAAFVQDPTGAGERLVPIRVKECTPDGLLASIVYIDTVGCNETAAQNALLTGIINTRVKPSSAPLFPGSPAKPSHDEPSFPGNWPEKRRVPYKRNLFFTGRDALLSHLYQQFTSTPTISLTQTRAISGLGGIGKTQTALEYLYRYEDTYRFVFWITAATEETLLADFEQLATDLAIPGRDPHNQTRTIEAVKEWFSRQQDWLLVFDNADDLQIIQPYLPDANRPRRHILLTTRVQALGSLAHPINIKKMDQDESVLLLLRRARILTLDQPLDQADPQERNDAQAIIDTLDGLPLAIDQAGAYIEENGINPSEYLQLYQNHHRQLLDRRGQLAPGHPETVATTWSLSLEKIEQANPAAIELLRLCAFLAPDNIPTEAVAKGAPHFGPLLKATATDPLKLNEAIEILKRYSFLQRNAKTQTLSMHRLVQTVIKDEMNGRTQRSWAERATRAVNEIFPYSEFSTWALCETYLPHAELCQEYIEKYAFDFSEAAELLHKIALYWQGRAVYNYEIALMCRAMGSYEQALSLYQRPLAIYEKTLGPDHPDTTATLHELARLYQAMGSYEQALPLYQRALAISEKMEGPDHPDTATTMDKLAGLYQNMGSYEQALSLFQHALSIKEKTRGPDHPDTATTLHALASLYQAMGSYEQALPLYQRALSIKEKTLGLDHPSTRNTLNALAGFYQDRDN